MFRSARGRWTGGKLSQAPGVWGGALPEGRQEPLQVWEQDKGVTRQGLAWGGPFAAWGIHAQCTIGPKS